MSSLAYFEARLAAARAMPIAAARLATPGPFGKLASGNYYFCSSSAATNTSAALGIGTLRVSPWFVPNSLTLTRIGAEITVVGDAGSHFRLGIYPDSGQGGPGAVPVLDAGTILGDSATVQEITISQALTAGLYWVGGVVQDVTTTQPTVRVTSGQNNLGILSAGTTKPAANAQPAGIGVTGVTGALPSSPTWVNVSTQGPRIFVKVA